MLLQSIAVLSVTIPKVSEESIELCRYLYMHNNLYLCTLFYTSQLFMQFGLPRVITSDQGSEFNNNRDKKLMKKMKIDHCLTTPYYPQVQFPCLAVTKQYSGISVKYVLKTACTM